MKKKWLIMSALVLSLGLTACSGGDNDEEVTDPPATEENQDTEDDVVNEEDTDVESEEADDDKVREGSEDYDEIELTIEDAYAKFSEEKPNADLQKLELNYDDEDGYTYKIEGNDGMNYQEMKIDANTGDLSDVEEKEEDRDEDKIFASTHIDKLTGLVDKSVDEIDGEYNSMEWEVEMDDDVPTLTVSIDKEDGQVDYVYNLETEELIEEEQ